MLKRKERERVKSNGTQFEMETDFYRTHHVTGTSVPGGHMHG